MSVTRIWVFDPANNTDHEAFGLPAWQAERDAGVGREPRAGLGVP